MFEWYIWVILVQYVLGYVLMSRTLVITNTLVKKVFKLEVSKTETLIATIFWFVFAFALIPAFLRGKGD